MERFFKLGVLIQIVKNRLRMRVSFKFYHDANVFGGFVANVSDSFYFLLMHKVGNLRQKVGFVNTKRNRCNNNLAIPFLPFRNLCVSADDHATPARGIRVRDVFFIECDASCREIWTLHEFQQVVGCRIPIFNKMNRRLAYLANVVRRNIRRHSDGDTESAVCKKIRERRG